MSIRSVLALSFLTFTPLQATIIHQVDPVLVTATRTEKSMLEVPASLSVVDTKKLERYAPQSLTETLKDVPNVSFEGGPRRTAAEVNIRGFGPGRVVMKMDGVRQNFESGHRGQIFIDPDLLKQVDIVRGPQSTLHGSGALGGIVGFFTKDARDMLKQNEKWGGFAKTGYGTRSDETFQTASAFGRYEETADGLVYITKRQHNDLRAPHGQRIMYSKDDTLSGLAKGNLYLGEFHTLKGAAHHFYDDHKIPASPQLAAGNRNRLVHRFTNQSQYQLGYAYDNEDQKWIKLKANASLNHTHIFEKGIDSTTTLNPRDRTDYTTYGFDIANTTAVDICPEISAESTYGLEFYRDEQSSRRNGVERGAFPKASSQVFSLFGEKDLNITKYVTLTPGIRWDHFRLRGNRVNLTRNYNRALPKGIITLKPMEQIRIYGLYAEGYRVPTLSELFSNGIHFNGLSRGPRVIFPSNFFVPNLNLKPESNKTFEAGINAGFDDVLCKDDRLVTKVSGFVTHSRNFIDMIVDRKGGTTTRINVAKTRVKGFEAEMTYKTPCFYGGVQGAYLRGRDVSAHDNLASIPGQKIGTHVGIICTKYNLDLGLRSTFVTTQNRLPQRRVNASRITLKRTPGFGVHDIYAVYEPPYAKGLKVHVGLDNVFNKSYRYHLSALPQQGRNFKISGSITF